jgi:hypothetical protein
LIWFTLSKNHRAPWFSRDPWIDGNEPAAAFEFIEENSAKSRIVLKMHVGYKAFFLLELGGQRSDGEM